MSVTFVPLSCASYAPFSSDTISTPREMSAMKTLFLCQYGAHDTAESGRQYPIWIGLAGLEMSRNRVPCSYQE